MDRNIEGNPFSALFPTTKDAESYRQEQKSSEEPPMQDIESVTLLEELLLVTTRGDEQNYRAPRLVLTNTANLSVENLNFVLFERLLFNVEGAEVRWSKKSNFSTRNEDAYLEQVQRSEAILYLFEVYERCSAKRDSPHAHLIQKVLSGVVVNLSTALEQPELYAPQQVIKQFSQLIHEKLSLSTALEALLRDYIDYLKKEQNNIPVFFNQIIDDAMKEVSKCSLTGVDFRLLDIVEIFSKLPPLALLLVKQPAVSMGYSGARYQHTILGSLLNISCLPKGFSQEYEFFENPSTQSSQVHNATEQSIWNAQWNLHSRIYRIFHNLLKTSEVCKDGLLRWIEGCLQSNSGRAGLWHLQGGGLEAMTYVNDGFMINLGAVMLQLAAPFTKDIMSGDNPTTNKILKVDPTYCIASNSKQGVYSGDLGKQTTLTPRPDGESLDVKTPESYSFITTCFYLTHRALHLGVQVVFQKLHKVSQDLGNIQNEYQEISSQGSSATEMIMSHMERKTTHLLSLKASVFEPHLVENMLEMLTATEFWLNQVALTPPNQTSSVLEYRNIILPIPEDSGNPSKLLMCVPEFIVETLVESIRTLKRFSTNSIFMLSQAFLNNLMSFVVVYMGSSERIYNPHVRAHLAECLESLISDNSNNSVGLMIGSRETLFTEHPLRSHLVISIIQVFVSIEMTGQSVQFEEKFNYRRPMYVLMKYLWKIKEHRESFITLANVALSNMEAAQPPLFLRFVNLLINDAIFLLDEGLSYMTQIREIHNARDNGEWNSLSEEQRTEKESNLQHLSQLARFHNMLGTSTIEILIRISKRITRMLTHSTLVDRMAAMLNHFLEHLVGPKQRNLKVKDMAEKYEFRPVEIVSNICMIYTNLGDDVAFCMAVYSDGRSYSPQLFIQVCNILDRTHYNKLSDRMKLVGERVRVVGFKQQEDEDLACAAPDEFLDPIMSHLMTDPVLLPTSNMTCDRTTIARHLLSDQIDPFNRQPLTMEQVIPNVKLNEQIQTWLQDQREQKRRQKNDSQEAA